MVEVIVDPAPDPCAGGEEGEVGYASMQHTTQTPTQTTFYPLSPTSLALPSRCGREHSCDGGKLVTGQSSQGRSLLDLENFQLLLSVLGHQGGYKVVLT